jgi:hypothetical protein
MTPYLAISGITALWWDDASSFFVLTSYFFARTVGVFSFSNLKKIRTGLNLKAELLCLFEVFPDETQYREFWES